MQLPCGRCLGCRKRRSREWAVRCLHEASLHEHNAFVTLTYAPEHLPANGFLQPDDLRLFLLRVRNALRRRTHPYLLGDQLRYFAVGEYGDHTWRPHYHAVLFGVGFGDRVAIPRRRGPPIWNSQTLRDLWGKGNVSWAPVTPRSAMYTAQYSLKKQSKREWHIHDEHGEVAPQPFMRCSTKPGIGFYWLWRWGNDTQHGLIHTDGKPLSVPRYYQTLLRRDCPELHEQARCNARDYALSARSASLEAAERIAERHLQLTNPRQLSEV